MADQDGASQCHAESLRGLRRWLYTEMSVSRPEEMTFARAFAVSPLEQEGVELTVRVQNDAPMNSEGGDVVFIGVGLRVSDGREQHTDRPSWLSTISKARPSDRSDLHRRYERGGWVGGREAFPAVTADERSFGEVLFPGECVVYEMRIPTAILPYTAIQVEGSVSRRHLFHFVQPTKGLERWTRPLLLETFHALDALDIHKPILMTTEPAFELGPQTTLADIETFKTTVGDAMEEVNLITQELNKLYASAPNQELRDFIKIIVGQYLSSVRQAGLKALDSFSSGDTETMCVAVEGLRQQLLGAEEVKRSRRELMSLFEVNEDSGTS